MNRLIPWIRAHPRHLIRLGVTWVAPAVALACSADKMMAPGVPELSIAPNGGNSQTGVAGALLPNPIVVQVAGVTPVNGQIVNFVVTLGGGSVFANAVPSWRPTSGPWANMDGIAQNRWTLGTTAGPQTVEARLVNPLNGATLSHATGAAGVNWTLGRTVGPNTLQATAPRLQGSPVIFTATALVGLPAQIAIYAGNSQKALLNAAVAIAPAVTVSDQYGNPNP